MFNATFDRPDLTTFTGLDGLGLVALGQRIEADRAVIACEPTGSDQVCHRCGQVGVVRDTLTRRLAHVPFGWRPTVLLVRVHRYRCPDCKRVWRQDMSAAAEPRACLSRAGLRWGLEGIVVAHLSMARVAEGLGVAWNTANDAVLAEGQRVLLADPGRFDGVKVIGVDEHVWRHTRNGDRFVTVIIDLTPVRDRAGPARLLDMVPGRSGKVFKTWLQARPASWRDGIEVVAMDGFTGFKTAAVQVLPQAVEVMDPFHVVRLAGDALEDCRQRIQRQTLGRRGRRTDPLFNARRTLLTGQDLMTAHQWDRIGRLFTPLGHAPVEATWGVYQQLVAAYRHPDPTQGKKLLASVIRSLSTGVPPGLPEIRRLGSTLKRRAVDILAYFDKIGTSNGPTEAINGRLEHLRGTALGFRNLTNYIARSLLETGGFRPQLHPRL